MSRTSFLLALLGAGVLGPRALADDAPAGRITRPPAVIEPATPEYPAEARDQGITGTVTLEIENRRAGGGGRRGGDRSGRARLRRGGAGRCPEAPLLAGRDRRQAGRGPHRVPLRVHALPGGTGAGPGRGRRGAGRAHQPARPGAGDGHAPAGGGGAGAGRGQVDLHRPRRTLRAGPAGGRGEGGGERCGPPPLRGDRGPGRGQGDRGLVLAPADRRLDQRDGGDRQARAARGLAADHHRPGDPADRRRRGRHRQGGAEPPRRGPHALRLRPAGGPRRQPARHPGVRGRPGGPPGVPLRRPEQHLQLGAGQGSRVRARQLSACPAGVPSAAG